MDNKNDAVWVDVICPICIQKRNSNGMMMADNFGICCVIDGCGWSATYREMSAFGKKINRNSFVKKSHPVNDNYKTSTVDAEGER